MIASNLNGTFRDQDVPISKTWIISSLAGELLLSLYMHYQQYSHIHSVHGVPRSLQKFGEGIYTSVDLDVSREFVSERLLHSAWKKLYTVILWMITIHVDGIHQLWKISQVISPLWPSSIDPIISRNMSFALVLFLANEVVLLPVTLNSSRLREKYGPRKELRKGRISDWTISFLRSLILNVIPMAIIAGFLTWILKVLDSKPFQTQVIIITSFVYVFILLYPSFDIWCQLHEHRKLSPRSSQNRLRLERLCAFVGFPRRDLLLLQRGHGASHDNAFYYGFLWFRRIVVFHDPNSGSGSPHASDTILSSAEVEAIVAHELGHWKYGHSNKDLLMWHAMHISTVILAFAVRSRVEVFQYFGLPVHVGNLSEGVMFLPGVFIAYNLIMRFYFYGFECLYQARQHLFEKQADEFATRLRYSYGRDLGKALVKISIMSKAFPSQDSLYSLFYHSHPSLVTRLQLISKWEWDDDDGNLHASTNSRPYRISRTKLTVTKMR